MKSNFKCIVSLFTFLIISENGWWLLLMKRAAANERPSNWKGNANDANEL